MPNYICYRCNYKTDHKTSMYTHFLKSVKCCKNIDSLKYTDDEIIKYSLCKIINHDKLNFNVNSYNCNKTITEFIN